MRPRKCVGIFHRSFVPFPCPFEKSSFLLFGIGVLVVVGARGRFRSRGPKSTSYSKRPPSSSPRARTMGVRAHPSEGGRSGADRRDAPPSPSPSRRRGTLVVSRHCPFVSFHLPSLFVIVPYVVVCAHRILGGGGADLRDAPPSPSFRYLPVIVPYVRRVRRHLSVRTIPSSGRLFLSTPREARRGEARRRTAEAHRDLFIVRSFVPSHDVPAYVVPSSSFVHTPPLGRDTSPRRDPTFARARP